MFWSVQIHCKLHWSVSLVQTNPILHWPLQNQFCFPWQLHFHSSLSYSLEVPSLFYFGVWNWVWSGCEVVGVFVWMCVIGLASGRPKTNLFFIPFLCSLIFIPELCIPQTLSNTFSFVKQWLHYSGLHIFRSEKRVRVFLFPDTLEKKKYYTLSIQNSMSSNIKNNSKINHRIEIKATSGTHFRGVVCRLLNGKDDFSVKW